MRSTAQLFAERLDCHHTHLLAVLVAEEGQRAFRHGILDAHDFSLDLLKVGQSELVAKTRKVMTQLKDKERELEELKLKMASGSAVEATARTIAGVQVHVQRTDGLDVNGMRALADQLRDKLKSGVVALGAANDGKVSLLVVVTKDLIPRLKAGDLIKEMAAEVGGTGGGRPEMAQAGGKDPAKLDVALEKVFGLVERMLQRYTDAG